MPKFYKWTVEISVAAEWVADGFDLEDGDAVAAMLLEGRLSHCTSAEVKGRILKAPDRKAILREQGYPEGTRFSMVRVSKYAASQQYDGAVDCEAHFTATLPDGRVGDMYGRFLLMQPKPGHFVAAIHDDVLARGFDDSERGTLLDAVNAAVDQKRAAAEVA